MDTNEVVVQNSKEKMDKGSAIAYAIGYSSTGIIWYMINNYLMLFYTDVVGLAAGAISMIMLVSRIWDAVNDPMMGAIVDRTHTKWGKFKPYIAFGAPFLAIFNILTFTVWPLTGTTKVVVCLLCYIGCGMAYTVLQVAINGLVNRLSNSSQTKMDMISIANVTSSVVNTILGACVMPMILFFSKSDVANGHGYFMGTIVLSIVSIPLFWFCAYRCREVKAVKETVTENSKAALNEEKVPLTRSLKSIFKNRMIMICVICVFFGAMSMIARMSLMSYYLIYCVGAYTVIAPTFTLVSVSQTVGNLLIPFLTRKFGKLRWYIISMVINSGAMLLLFFAPSRNVPILLILSGIYGFTNSGASIVNAMMCDSIEYGDYKYGTRDDALAFSIYSFGVKVAQAITGAGSVLLLAAVGYVAGAEQSATALTGINVIVNLLPAIVGLLAVVPMIFYKLDEKTMEKIRVELEERRSGKAVKVEE